MKTNYKESLKAVLKHEGGYVNHPKDPGGATNKGVTQRVYDAYRKANGLSPQAVRNIFDAEVEAIYRLQYWNMVKGDDLPSGIDYCVFDYAVNSGVRRSALELQKVLGVKRDGVIGIVTVQAAMDADAKTVVKAICASRLAFLKNLKIWSTFGKGWAARVSGVLAMSLRLADLVPEAPSQEDAPQIPPVKPPAPAKGLLAIILDFIMAIFGRK